MGTAQPADGLLITQTSFPLPFVPIEVGTEVEAAIKHRDTNINIP
jgi:hypothetical protein